MLGYIQSMRKMIGNHRLIVVGAGVILYKDEKVLLQKRRDNLCWAIHGGCVEVGEKVEEAAKRELLEETGLIANKLELLNVFSGEATMYTYPNGDEVYIVCVIFTCNDFSGQLLAETDETTKLEWFDLKALPNDINPPDIEPLNMFVERFK